MSKDEWPAGEGALPLYPEAPESLIKAWQRRRRPLVFKEDEALPPLDCDLVALRETLVQDNPRPEGKPSSFALKRHELRRDFIGQSELCCLNGLLIAILRKRKHPAPAAALFHRIWAEQSEHLLAQLSPRWLISSLITFGDHGQSERQRRLGLAMNVMLSLMKLYEYERLHSGLRADQPFSGQTPAKGGLPFDMPSFSLTDGGLDINLIAPLWQMARDTPLAGPIALRLFERLNLEERGIFRRLDLMREEMIDAKAERKRAGLRDLGSALAAPAPPSAD